MFQWSIFIIRLIVFVLITILGIFNYKLQHLGELQLYSLNVHGEKKNFNMEKYNEFKNKPKGIVVFNHCTFFDHLILMKEFGETPAFIASNKFVFFPFDYLLKKYGGVVIEKGKSTSEIINETVNNRKPGDKILAIAPTGGYSINEDQNKLCDFKLGAFNPLSPVLPVLIKYHPYHNWKTGVSLAQYAFDIMTNEKIYYTVEVLDEVVPLEGETVEAFSDRVKLIMEQNMEKIDVLERNKELIKNEYKGSGILSASSHLFLFNSLLFIYFKKYDLAFVCFILYLTSILYHSTGKPHFEFIDNFSNRFIVSVYLIWFALKNKFFIPPFIALLVYVFYIVNRYLNRFFDNVDIEKDENIHHFICVHIPIYLAIASYVFMLKK